MRIPIVLGACKKHWSGAEEPSPRKRQQETCFGDALVYQLNYFICKMNILICGTPGTGKTTLASELSLRTGMQHINISELVKERKLYSEFDERFQSYVIDEDKVAYRLLLTFKVLDELEDVSDLNISAGGKIIEYHGCDFFPQRYFALVVVLRTDNTVLWDRLEKRFHSD